MELIHGQGSKIVLAPPRVTTRSAFGGKEDSDPSRSPRDKDEVLVHSKRSPCQINDIVSASKASGFFCDKLIEHSRTSRPTHKEGLATVDQIEQMLPILLGLEEEASWWTLVTAPTCWAFTRVFGCSKVVTFCSKLISNFSGQPMERSDSMDGYKNETSRAATGGNWSEASFRKQNLRPYTKHDPNRLENSQKTLKISNIFCQERK